jgi:hypothetical protein
MNRMASASLPSPSPSAASAHHMIGGAKFQEAVLNWTKQSNHIFLTLFGIILVLWATYAEKLPALWRWQLSTTVGRLLLLFVVYITHYVTESWILSLILTIAIALTWANRPIYEPALAPALAPTHPVALAHPVAKEGFAAGPQQGIKVTPVQGNRWFVEKALHENPSLIVEDRVTTTSIQDSSRNTPGRVSR